MTILIADDEKLVRYTLVSMLKEIGIPASSIQVACDGQETVDKIAAMNPDLAFVDIKMPRLNGLEAIKRGRALSPHTKWIILTSYSMFEYAKQAVDLGASAYLLKPVSPQELSRAVGEVTRVARGVFQRLNDEFEAHLSALLHKTTSIEHETLHFVADAVFWGTLLVFDSKLPKNELLLHEQRVCDLIRRKRTAVVDRSTRVALCRLSDGQLVLVGAWIPGRGERASTDAMRDLFHRLHLSLKPMLPQAVWCSMIVGERRDNYKEFYEHLCLLGELAPLRVVAGAGGLIPWSSIRNRQGVHSDLELCRNLTTLSALIREGTYLDYLRQVDELVVNWQGVNDDRRLEISTQVSRYLQAALDFQPSCSMDNSGWYGQLRQQGRELFEKDGKPRDTVDQIVAFLDSNYMEDIGVAQIADDLDLTPNYLSHLFHKKTGTTFVKYLTRLRMAKAREFLADPSLQVKQVARKVGYSSSRHFSGLFNLHEGLSPSQYRRARSNGSPKQ